MRNPLGLAVLASALSAGTLAAQSIVVPGAYANLDGNTFSVWPYDAGAATYQMYIHRSQLNAWSTGTQMVGLSLRITGGEPTYALDLDYTDYSVVVCESTAASITASFARINNGSPRREPGHLCTLVMMRARPPTCVGGSSFMAAG